MKPCECGCNEVIETGNFKQGHDQKLRLSIEKRVGGLLNLRELIENLIKLSEGKISPNDLEKIAHKIIVKTKV